MSHGGRTVTQRQLPGGLDHPVPRRGAWRASASGQALERRDTQVDRMGWTRDQPDEEAIHFRPAEAAQGFQGQLPFGWIGAVEDDALEARQAARGAGVADRGQQRPALLRGALPLQGAAERDGDPVPRRGLSAHPHSICDAPLCEQRGFRKRRVAAGQARQLTGLGGVGLGSVGERGDRGQPDLPGLAVVQRQVAQSPGAGVVAHRCQRSENESLLAQRQLAETCDGLGDRGRPLFEQDDQQLAGLGLIRGA